MIFYLRVVIAFFSVGVNAFAQIDIVASIKPIHSIASYLTKDISAPKLLLNSRQSAHNFHLKPSQLSAINKADLIIFMHPDFESGLKKTFAKVAGSKKFIVADIATIDLYKNQSIADEHGIKGMTDEHNINYHLWLDVDNMQIFAKALTNRLAILDAKNKVKYEKNLIDLNAELDKLKQDIKLTLLPYKSVFIATFSDVFNYFIKANNLQNLAVLTNFHHDRLSVYKVLRARNIIKDKKIHCLMRVIDVNNKKINTIIEGFKVNTSSVDIIGFDINHGSLHYFALLTTITNKVVKCLQ